MSWAVTTEGERIFQRGIVLVKYEKSVHHIMSGIYNIVLFMKTFRTWSNGQVLFTIHIMITVRVNTISMSCDLPR